MIKERDGDNCLRICDVCGQEQWVYYWNAYKKDRHLCRYCSNHEHGKKKNEKELLLITKVNAKDRKT